jgi:hypothetical protein
MNKILGLALGLLLVLGMAGLDKELRAQVRGRGSTIQGDILRGEGQFLRGAGWYELNSARARNIDVNTWKKMNLEAERLYRNFMIERSQRHNSRKGLAQKNQQEIEKRYQEDLKRWRENPTPEDIYSGDALNVLAHDLANPNIDPYSWQSVQVPLPAQLSLTALTFKIVARQGSRLFQNFVAVDRITAAGEWPLGMRRPELDAERAAYKQAAVTVIGKCRKGIALDAKNYERLRGAVEALRKRVEDVVPVQDNMRARAREFVKGLDEATRVFADQAYAEQLIRDVSEHKATTVAELLAFMRQYKLLFAEAEAAPEVAQLYDGLYQLLRQQKEKLGPALESASPPEDQSRPPTPRLPDEVPRLMTDLRSGLRGLNYGNNPTRRIIRDQTIEDLTEAMNDAQRGSVSRDRLEKVRTNILELQRVSMRNQKNIQLLSEAARQITDIFTKLQIEAPQRATRSETSSTAPKAARPRAKAKKKGG